jgi:colanic acid biosynthesis glycosyl transferase WcaI
MRILLLSTYFRPDVASTGVIMSKLADEFAGRGHEVTVLTTVPHYAESGIWPEYAGKLIQTEDSGGIRIHRLYTHVPRDRANIMHRMLAYGSFSALALLRGVVLPRQDVILVPSPPLSNGVLAHLLELARGTPFVYNVQDIWPEVLVRAGALKDAKMIARLRRMEDSVYRHAAGVAVISEGFRQNLLAKGVPDEKISVIPNFIDTEFITPRSRNNVFSKAQGLDDKFVVLFAGNMGFSQGLETVIDAARLLKNKPEIQFMMVGSGAGKVQAEEYAEKLGLNNMRFLPYQPQEMLPEMYGASDVCLIPLRRGFSSESVPCKLFTIMAAGRPAVAAIDRESETWQLVNRGECGTCVEPESPDQMANAILGYYENAQARAQAGRAARALVEREFQAARIADQYLDVLERAAGKQPIRQGGLYPVRAQHTPNIG